jgi:hypothetical protein
MKDDQIRLAEAVREACVEAARRAFEEAGVSGLCFEGRLECAIDAIRSLDLAALIRQPEPPAQLRKHSS